LVVAVLPLVFWGVVWALLQLALWMTEG
jgi:hypothetical protein